MPRLRACVSVALLAVLCAAALVSPARAQFETRGSNPFIPGYPPASIALADFNHDSKLDLAAVSFSTAQVAVFLGNGNGTFQSPVYYSVGFEPGSVAIADFNHDGNLDLAVTGFGTSTGSISVLLGNGDGTFRAAPDVTLDAYPIFVAVGDFNGDGIPDLVASDSPYVSVMLGNGDGTFQPPINNTLFSPIYPAAIGVGDFNRDGKLDLVVAGQFGASSYAKVLLGNGDGTFQLGASYSIGDNPLSVAVADFRGIGILDLAIAGTGAGGVQVLLGNGDGTFQPPVDYETLNPTSWVTVGDFNLDGKLDLAVNTNVLPYYGGYATVLLGNGDGTFQPGADYYVATEAGFIAVGDLNGDKQPDLAVVGVPSETVVLLNTGVVSFSPTAPLSFNPQLLGTASYPQNVTLTNSGTTMLSITSISTKKPFQLGNGTTCGTSVAPGANCTLSVVFKPTVLGLKTGLLVLNDSASSKPQVIELSGTGTTLTVSPSQLNFGSQKVGTKSPPKNVTVKNTGNSAVSVTGVSITGSDPQDFVETNTCGSQINPGATCTISVHFTPTRTGTRSAAAAINGPGGVVWQHVQLTGMGT
jgi:hypothetical protein